MHKHFISKCVFSVLFVAIIPVAVLAVDEATAGLGPSASGARSAASPIGVSDGTTGAVLQPANPQNLQSAASDSLTAPSGPDGASTLKVAPSQSVVSSYMKGETDPSSKESPDGMSTADVLAWLEIALIVVVCSYIFASHSLTSRHLRRNYRPEHKR